MTNCQYKQSTEQYALFKNEVDLLKDFSQKLILSVLSNLFRTLRTHCVINSTLYAKNYGKPNSATAFTQSKCFHNNSNTFIQNCTMLSY
jgi:hypothetical protein